MSDAERNLRKSVREFLKKNGRTYAQAQDVKTAVDEVLVEARQAAIAAYSPPQDSGGDDEE
jgi:anti-sigma regulatory factor (Ser/Thr protein kinase)